MFNPSLFQNARCTICNSVSSGEIATEYGEMSAHSFCLDPGGMGYLCYECFSEIDEIGSEFDQEDGVNEDE